MKKYKTPVKASKLIAELEQGSYNAEIVDSGDLYPFLHSVDICVDEDTHICSLSGYYAYCENSEKYSVSPGTSEAVVLGVVFSRDILCSRDSETIISGRSIVYDKGLNESDVIKAADNAISFIDYDPDMFPFDEDGVTDSDIIEHFYCECDVFALNADGEVCAFDDEEEAKAAGCTVIDTDEAYARLAKERPGMDFDLMC